MRYVLRFLFLVLVTPFVLFFLPIKFFYFVVVRTIKNVKAMKFARKNFADFRTPFYEENPDERMAAALRSMSRNFLREHNQNGCEDKC